MPGGELNRKALLPMHARTQKASVFSSAWGVYSNTISNCRPGPTVPARVAQRNGDVDADEAAPCGCHWNSYLRGHAWDRALGLRV